MAWVLIFHLVGRDEWVAAGSGVAGYRPASLDAEGFVHFSTLEQVVETANRFYAGRDDLLLLVVDPSKLTAELRWEPPADPPGRDPGGGHRGGALFPHLYGPVDGAAVVAVHPFPRHPSGEFTAVPEATRRGPKYPK